MTANAGRLDLSSAEARPISATGYHCHTPGVTRSRDGPYPRRTQVAAGHVRCSISEKQASWLPGTMLCTGALHDFII